MFLSRLLFLVIAILVAGNLILVTFHLSNTSAVDNHINKNFVTVTYVKPKPNALAVHLNAAVNTFGQTMSSAGHTVSSMGHTMQNSVASAGRSMIGGMASVASATAHVADSVTNPPRLSSVVTPLDKTDVPVISAPDAPAAAAAQQPASQPAPAPAAAPAPQWPIHGIVTLPFGVSDMPYERVHTGIDISDGNGRGTTPIRPFKPGVVTQVIHYGGLGNHVIVDHGGGVTSVYGHMHATAVQPGQAVDENSVLGYEGSTGAATGTHVHFEIRINGQAQDPRKFIAGNP